MSAVELVPPAPALELAPGTCWAAVSDGAALLTPDGLVVIRGVEVIRWLDRLLPLVDGTRTVGALVSDLGEQQAAQARGLLAGLQRRGVLREVGSAIDAPAETATVVGSGSLAAAVVSALRADGTVVEVEAAETDASLEVRTDDRRAELVRRPGELWLVGPRPHDPGCAGPADVGRRAAALGTTGESADLDPAPARTAVAAGALAHGLRSARPDVSGPGTAVRVWGSAATDDVTHRVAPHPGVHPIPLIDADPQHGVGRWRARAATPALDWSTFSRRAAALTDDRFGLLGRPTEGDLTQLPLPVSTVTVSDPFGHLGGPFTLTDGEFDFDRARYRTVLRGLAGYAGLAADPRRIAGGTVAGVALGRGADATTVITAATAVPVPAERVFPVLTGADPTTYTVPPGTAAGLDVASALAGAAAGYVRDLTLAELGSATVVALDPRTDPDPDVRRAIALLAAVRRGLVLRRIWGALMVPVVLAAFGDVPVAAAAGPGALREALRLALLADQAERSGEDAYAPRFTLPAALPEPTAATSPGPDADPVVALTAARRVLVVPLDHDPALSWLPSLLRVMIDD